MARPQETSSKKDMEKKRQRKKQDKEEKRQERQANNNKGKSLDDMMAYLDEHGNITSTPPDPSKKIEVNLEDIAVSTARHVPGEEQSAVRNGVVTFFNDAKGFGFIKDLKTQESIFVHINQLSGPLKEHDKVSFEVENGPKGLNAVRVKTA